MSSCARQEYIMVQSRCNILIIDEDIFERTLKQNVSLPKNIILMESTSGAIKGQIQSEEKLEIERPLVTSKIIASRRPNEGLAYVLYTSGSTGNPKGVMVPQAGVVSFMKWFSKELNTSHKYKVLALATFSFDISVLEMFLPLTTGGTMILVFSATQKDPFRIIDIINQYEVDLLNLRLVRNT
jgi:non-ribosomal peptide synthetase component F